MHVSNSVKHLLHTSSAACGCCCTCPIPKATVQQQQQTPQRPSVPLSTLVACRLRKLDEANGQIALNENHFDEQTDNGLMTERTGHVHHATKQSIVRQWLDGAEQEPPSTGSRFSHTYRVLNACGVFLCSSIASHCKTEAHSFSLDSAGAGDNSICCGCQ